MLVVTLILSQVALIPICLVILHYLDEHDRAHGYNKYHR